MRLTLLTNPQGRGQLLCAAALTELTLDGLPGAEGGEVVQLPTGLGART
ncbi:hypothetical protein ACFQ7F_03000 [Streptomyces sp. NPDC056486]